MSHWGVPGLTGRIVLQCGARDSVAEMGKVIVCGCWHIPAKSYKLFQVLPLG